MDWKESNTLDEKYRALLRASETLIELSSIPANEEVSAETSNGNIVPITPEKLQKYKKVWKERFIAQNHALKKKNRHCSDLSRTCVVPEEIAALLSKYPHKVFFRLEELLPPARVAIETLELGILGDHTASTNILSTPAMVLKVFEELKLISYEGAGCFSLQKTLSDVLGVHGYKKTPLNWEEIRAAVLSRLDNPGGFKVGKRLRASYARISGLHRPIKAACLALCISYDAELLWEKNQSLYILASLNEREESLFS